MVFIYCKNFESLESVEKIENIRDFMHIISIHKSSKIIESNLKENKLSNTYYLSINFTINLRSKMIFKFSDSVIIN